MEGGVEVHAVGVYVSNVHDGWGWNDVEGRHAYAMCCDEQHLSRGKYVMSVVYVQVLENGPTRSWETAGWWRRR